MILNFNAARAAHSICVVVTETLSHFIGASAGAQFSLESEKWNNGVFTAAVIEGLRDKKADWNTDDRITVSELKIYLSQRVSELTAGAQKPSVVAFEQDQDFDLIR